MVQKLLFHIFLIVLRGSYLLFPIAFIYNPETNDLLEAVKAIGKVSGLLNHAIRSLKTVTILDMGDPLEGVKNKINLLDLNNKPGLDVNFLDRKKKNISS